VGTLAAVGLVTLGVALLVAAGITPTRDPGPAPEPAGLLSDLLALRPAGWLWAGLLVTLALPTTRVALAAVGFLRTGDRRAAAVAAGVLSVLVVAFTVARLTSQAT